MDNFVIRCQNFLSYTFYIFIFLEGVLRKWVFPGIPGFILYTIKYILLLLIAIFYLMGRSRRLNSISTPISKAYLLYIWIVVISVVCVTFLSNGFLVGIITMIQYIAPVILIFVIPQWLSDKYRLRSFMKVSVVIAYIILILAIVQYASPPTAYINKYASEMENGIAQVGNAARVCSVFSYITPFGDSCIVILTFTMLLMSTRLSNKYKTIIITLFIGSILGSFMTGSRSVVIIISAIVVFFALYELFFKRNPKFFFSILFLGFLLFAFYKIHGIVAIDNFIERVRDSSHDVNTRITRTFDISRMFNYSGAFGRGAGIANSSVQGLLTHHSLVDWEEEIGRVMIEFGFLGFLLITGIRWFALINMIKISRSVNDHYLSSLSWACTIVVIPMSFYIQMCLYNWFAYMVYFTMLGLNISIYQIDKRSENRSIFSKAAIRG